jgi:hypothetical protein
MSIDEDTTEQYAMDVWRLTNLLLAKPLPFLAANLDTFVDAYNNLGDIIRLGNMGKHEEFQE